MKGLEFVSLYILALNASLLVFRGAEIAWSVQRLSCGPYYGESRVPLPPDRVWDSPAPYSINTWSSVLGPKRPEREYNQSPPCGFEFDSGWNSTSVPGYVFKACAGTS